MVAEGLLGCVGADELLEHLLLGSGFGDAGDLGDVEESGHRVRPWGGPLSVAGAGVDEFVVNGERVRGGGRWNGKGVCRTGLTGRGSKPVVTGETQTFVLCLLHLYLST